MAFDVLQELYGDLSTLTVVRHCKTGLAAVGEQTVDPSGHYNALNQKAFSD